MIQAHSSNQDPVLVDLVIALPGSSPQDIGQLLVSNHYAELVVPQTISYMPATPPSNGRVTVTFISDDGIVYCQAANSGISLSVSSTPNNVLFLDVHLKSMMDYLQSVSKKGPCPQLDVGQPCVAVFSDDNLWYRAKVISLTDTTAYVSRRCLPVK